MTRFIRQFLWDKIIFILIISGFATMCLIIKYPSFLPKNKEFESGIASLVLYFGILYNVLVYKISVDKFFKELFNEFNKRFDKMNENLNLIAAGKFVEVFGSRKTKEDIIIDYLNLCSEEFYWFKKGRIDFKVWKSWKEGMLFYLRNENFKATIEYQKKERNSYYGLYDELKL